MNTALIASAFHPSLGGVEEAVRQLAHAQRCRGDLPIVLTNRWPKSLAAVEAFEGFTLYRYAFRVPDRTLRQLGGAFLFGPSTLKRFCRDLRTHGTEVIHVQCVSSNAYYALRAAKRLRLPLVVTLQGELTMDAGGLFQHSAFAQSLMREVVLKADAITACSTQTLLEAEKFVGYPLGPRGRVIPNGVRLQDFVGVEPFPHPRPYILGIGRFVPQKGFDILVRAFAVNLERQGFSASFPCDLLLAGDGEERNSLERLVQELRLNQRVKFLGRVGRDDAARLFEGCLFFVLPSRHEPLGIVNLEAMAARKAVVASRVGGVPEVVVDGVTGLLVPPGDPQPLADAIGKLMEDADLRNRLGEEGRFRVGQFDWALVAQQYAETYNDAIVTHSRRDRRSLTSLTR